MPSAAAQKIRSELIRDTLDDTPLVEQRIQWDAQASEVPLPDGVELTRVQYGSVPCMLHTPASHDENAGVVVYVHGGGLVTGSVITARDWCARLASGLGQQVVAIDYRLAPEYPFPAAVDDVRAVCAELVCRTSIVAMGADSTGCIPALASLISLRDAGIALPGVVFFQSPSLDLTFSGRSMSTNAQLDPLLSEAVLKSCAVSYAGTHDCGSPAVSPLFGDLRALPPLLVHVDEHELLLDDARRLKEWVTRAGGQIRLIEVNGLWHCWPCWGDFPEAATVVDDIRQHIELTRGT